VARGMRASRTSITGHLGQAACGAGAPPWRYGPDTLESAGARTLRHGRRDRTRRVGSTTPLNRANPPAPDRGASWITREACFLARLEAEGRGCPSPITSRLISSAHIAIHEGWFALPFVTRRPCRPARSARGLLQGSRATAAAFMHPAPSLLPPPEHHQRLEWLVGQAPGHRAVSIVLAL